MRKVFLLADDDSDDIQLFQEALFETDESAIFLHAQNGKAALEILDDESLELPDIIFLDINMPVMNGWQCLTKIKSIEAFKNIPVIIYSTTSHHREIERALDAGAMCFFSKPKDFKELKKALKVISDNLDGDLPAAIELLGESKNRGLIIFCH